MSIESEMIYRWIKCGSNIQRRKSKSGKNIVKFSRHRKIKNGKEEE